MKATRFGAEGSRRSEQRGRQQESASFSNNINARHNTRGERGATTVAQRSDRSLSFVLRLTECRKRRTAPLLIEQTHAHLPDTRLPAEERGKGGT